MRGLDLSAIGLSALCGVHCLALPAAAAVLPAVGLVADHDSATHLWLFAAALGLALSAWRLGRAPTTPVMLLGGAGLAAMLAGAIEPLAHQSLGVGLTLSGATALGLAHVINLLRRPVDACCSA